MKTIRIGVFETNSSSTHSMTIVTKDDYEEWTQGRKFLYDSWEDELVKIEDADCKTGGDKRFLTYEKYKKMTYDTNDFYETSFYAEKPGWYVVLGYISCG